MTKQLTFLAALALTTILGAQTPKPAPPATYVTPQDMNAAFKAMPDQSAALIDAPTKVIDAGGHYLGVALVRRTSSDVNALSHDKIDEIYYILEGAGTLVTGGTIPGAEHSDSSASIGPTWRGKSIKDGQTRRVTPGDVIMITANTPHMFTTLDGPVKYLIYRVDNSKVIKLK